MPAARGRGKPPLAGGGLPDAGCDAPPPVPMPAARGRGKPPLAGGGGVVLAAASVPVSVAGAAGVLGGAGGGPGGVGACATGFEGAGEDELPPQPQVHAPTTAKPIHNPSRIVCCNIDMATRLSLPCGIIQLFSIQTACRIDSSRPGPRNANRHCHAPVTRLPLPAGTVKPKGHSPAATVARKTRAESEPGPNKNTGLWPVFRSPARRWSGFARSPSQRPAIRPAAGMYTSPVFRSGLLRGTQGRQTSWRHSSR